MNTAMTMKIGDSLHAGQMLREDHRRLRSLFREFDAADEDTKASIAQRAIEEIELHSYVEEECFYPAVRKATGDVDGVMEAREAHHAAKTLIAELKLMPSGRRFNAKFLTLAKAVAQHMKEEEGSLIPEAERGGIDMAALGQEMAAVKYGCLSESGGLSGRSGIGFGSIAAAAVVAGLAWLVLKPAE
jgi:hypothetical protein